MPAIEISSSYVTNSVKHSKVTKEYFENINIFRERVVRTTHNLKS